MYLIWNTKSMDIHSWKELVSVLTTPKSLQSESKEFFLVKVWQQHTRKVSVLYTVSRMP